MLRRWWQLLLAAGLLAGGAVLGMAVWFTARHETYIMRSQLMEPVIPAGSLVYLQRSAYYETGQIVAVWIETDGLGRTLVLRRLAAQEPDGRLRLQTELERRQRKEGVLVQRSDVQGRVVRAPHQLGYLLYVVEHPRAWYQFMIGRLVMSLGMLAGVVATMAIGRRIRRYWNWVSRYGAHAAPIV